MYQVTNNPLSKAREETGDSLEKLGKKLSLSRQYLSRAEHGTYSSLNRNLVRYIARVLEISGKEVERQYKAFQAEKRRETVERIGPPILSRRLSGEPGHVIFKRWRECYWPTTFSFASTMCVHPANVDNYEEAIVPALPTEIVLALNEVRLLDPNWSEKPNSPALPRALTVTRAGAEALRADLTASESTRGLRAPERG